MYTEPLLISVPIYHARLNKHLNAFLTDKLACPGDRPRRVEISRATALEAMTPLQSAVATKTGSRLNQGAIQVTDHEDPSCCQTLQGPLLCHSQSSESAPCLHSPEGAQKRIGMFGGWWCSILAHNMPDAANVNARHI